MSDSKLPLRVIGYANETTADGDVVLYVQRSPLDLGPESVLANPLILKQLVAQYLVHEAGLQLQAAGLQSIDSQDGKVPAAVRLARGVHPGERVKT